MNGDAATDSPILTVRNVGLYYWRRSGLFSRERFWALKDVSLDIHRGESLGVIGRNGAGKTTLLRTIAGIIDPDRGTVVNQGYQASMLSLQLGFLRHLTGRENAILSGLLLGFTRAEVESRMEAIVEFSELGDFIDQPIRTYSSGMSARLGFSVAFQMDPDILLIDEVMAVGDADFREKSMEVMREKLKSNKTIVMATHNGPRIREFCDRAVWVDDGVTRAEGPADDVMDEYEASLRRGKTVTAPAPKAAAPTGSKPAPRAEAN